MPSTKFQELTVDEWIDELDNGLLFRQQYGNEASWSDIESIFYNVNNSQMNAGPNIMFSTGDALLSELNVPNPYFTVKPTRPDFLYNSKLVETVDNRLIDTLGIKNETGTSILSSYLFGVGILKIGFDSEYGWDPTHDYGGTKDPLGLTLTQHDPKTGRLIEYSDIKPGMPWVRSVLPHDIVVPWGTMSLDDCPWIAHRIVRHVDDIKADPKYEKKKDLYPSMSMTDFVKSYQTVLKPYRVGSNERISSGTQEHHAVYCELWEIHDKRSGKIFVVSAGHDKFLRNEVNLLQMEGLPFVGYSFTPRARTFWTTSDAFYLKQQQKELSDITVQQTKLRRAMNFKFLYEEAAIDETEMRKLTSHDAGVGVKIKGGHDIEKAVKFFTAPPNYELQNQAAVVLQNLKQTVGFNSNTFGEYQSGRKTASEVNAVQQGSGQRMSRRQSILRDVYVKLFRKINPMIEAFWKSTQIQQVMGPNGQAQWVQFTGQHLAGEFTYECGFSDSTPETRDQRKQMALQMFQAMSQSPLVDPVALAKYIANEFNDVDFASIFRPGVLIGVSSADQSLQQSGPNPSGAAGLLAGGGGGNMGQGGQQAGAGLQRQQAPQGPPRQAQR